MTLEHDVTVRAQPLDVTVRAIQQQIHEWHNRNFPATIHENDQLVLTEEVGELSRAIVKMNQGIRGTKEEWMAEVYKEIGDVLIALISVANGFNIDVATAFLDRWETISKRDWNADRIQHGIEVA